MTAGLLVADGLIADGVLIDAAPPLGVLWVPLHEGLTVFYGRNGAGKSRLLRAITAALRGEAIDDGVASLHLSLADYGGTWNPHLLYQLARRVESNTRFARGRAASGGALTGDEIFQASRVFVPPDEEDDDWVARTAHRLAELVPLAVRDDVRLAEGHCHTPRLVLTAVGTPDEPAWEVHVSVVPSDRSEFFHEQVARWRPEALDRPFRRGNPPWAVRRNWPESLTLLTPGLAEPSAPVPVVVGQLSDPDGDLGSDDHLDARDVLNCRDASDDSDLERQTLEAIVAAATAFGVVDLIEFASNDDFEPSPAVAEQLAFLGQRATWFLQFLSGDDLGRLEPRLLHPIRWLVGRTVQWIGVDPYGNELPVSSLGAGSQRWANLAISMTLRSSRSANPAIFVIDEPERALHSAAQLQVAKAMTSVMLADDGIDHVVVAGIVASHSPAFLANPDARLVHVSRGTNGNVRLDEIDVTIGVEALVGQLGISHTDALLTVRTFVYVEGEHDHSILMALFGDVFRNRHAIVRTMRGAANVGAHLTADHILAYSDAKIRVVLDRIGGLAAQEWGQAVAAFRDGNLTTARRILDALPKPGRGGEAKWLSAAGVAALSRGQLDRIELVGLDKPDILQYLPVETIVPEPTSWGQLAAEWRADPQRGDFKDWLRSRKGAKFDSAKLAEIAERLDPTDLADICKVVEGL